MDVFTSRIPRSKSKTQSDKYFMLEEGHSSTRSLLKRSRVICPSLVHPVWHKALRHPKLLDVISQLVFARFFLSMAVYHLQGQTGWFTVRVNGKQNSGLVNFLPQSRLPFAQISSI